MTAIIVGEIGTNPWVVVFWVRACWESGITDVSDSMDAALSVWTR